MEGLLFLFFILAMGLITAKVAKDRGVPGSPILWFIGGALICIVALPAALLQAPDPKQLEKNKLAGGGVKKCPRCAELVKIDALVCRFCQHDFAAADRTRQATMLSSAPPAQKSCPKCHKDVMKEAVRCMHCGHQFEARQIRRAL
jgi:RNA polymerase subunit RPABC4/transcription elongation factor Spt4